MSSTSARWADVVSSIQSAAGGFAAGGDLAGELAVVGEHALADRIGHDAAVGPEQLHAVVLGRIVAGRDLDAAGAAELPDEDAGRRRGGDAGVEHRARAAVRSGRR